MSTLRVTGITEDSVTIEWSDPSSDGGSPTTGYVVEKRESRSQYWTQVTTVSARSTSCTIRHLHRTSKYYIRVAAQNEEGTGVFRELPEPITPMKPKSELSTCYPRSLLLITSVPYSSTPG